MQGSYGESKVDWREYIDSDPEVLYGKPLVKGTRIPAAFLLELFASGWTEDEVLEGYPELTREELRAVFAYASELAARDASQPVAP